MDSNTLLCNINRECIQTTPSKVCAPNDTAATRMKAIALNRMQNEFDRRVSMSFDEIEQEIDVSLKRLNDSVFRKRILNDILLQRYNEYAYSLGQRVVEIEHTESPYEPLRRMIMGQSDFVKRQTDIIRFVELFTREPMIDKNEEQYWLRRLFNTTTITKHSTLCVLNMANLAEMGIVSSINIRITFYAKSIL